MTHRQDAGKAEAWCRAECYAEMVCALRATGYRTYADARADAESGDPPRQLRHLRFECRWTALMAARAGIDERAHKGRVPGNGYRGAGGKRKGRVGRYSVQRSPDDYEPLPPAVLAECRVALARACAPDPSKGGRPKRQPLIVGRGT